MITNTIKAAVLIACMATTAAANDLTEACGNMGKYAEAIMIARQAGNPMSEVIDVATRSAKREFRDLFTNMIIEAYKVQVFDTHTQKRAAAKYFRDAAEVACFNAFGDLS